METTEQSESIRTALQHIRDNRPLRAEEICRDHLLMNPGSVHHIRLLGHALMKQKRFDEAEEQLKLALAMRRDFPQLYEDIGTLFALQEKPAKAVPFFEEALRREPSLATAHKKLGEALAELGKGREADEHFKEFFQKDPSSGVVAAAMDKLRNGDRDGAVESLRAVLREDPENIDAMRVLAIAFWQEDNNLADAEAWLRRAVSITPGFTAAWLTLGPVLLEMAKYPEAIDAFQSAIKSDPESHVAWAGLANAYAQGSYPEKALEAYNRAIELGADSAGFHMSHAHVLKTVGDQDAALREYRAAVADRPDFGEVYWSMANLKIFKFEDEEVDAMEEQLESSKLSDTAEVHFRFALGKAWEDRKDYDKAWHYYHTGNQAQRPLVSHDPVDMEKRHAIIMEIFGEEFLEKHAGSGCDAADPILIVGLPRTGSTLVEQILASHSQVEGTSELPSLSKMASAIGRYRPDGVGFPEAARDLSGRDWRSYGENYMEDTKRHRHTDKPFFTDKLPNNFPLVGLLHLILPNAKVINTRRHPMDSCLGAYKQLFARGQTWTYDIDDLSHYYTNYIRVMNHWHTVLPGKVLDVHYEDTVTDLETQVARILDHCGLPFEEECVRFHETERAVKTASSEQVRQPIYTGALGKWQKYEKHLDDWKEDLADVIDALPGSVKQAAS